MAFTKAKQNQSGYDTTTWDKVKNPVIEGHYIEHKTNIAGKPDSNLYVIKLESGEKKAVWSSKVLDDYFVELEIGDYVQIEFKGIKKISGGRTLNDYLVQVDPDKHEDF